MGELARKDSIDSREEREFRRNYSAYIQHIGQCLQLPQVTIATGIVFCHKFFAQHSHISADSLWVGAACLFLAGKAEETFRHSRDVLYWAHATRNNLNPEEIKKLSDKEFAKKLAEELFHMEEKVMSAIGFEFNVEHPYKPLITFIKQLRREFKGFNERAVAQVAWNVLNDGLRTPMWLWYKTEHIALAGIFLALKLLRVETPPLSWFHRVAIPLALLEEISSEMLRVYEEKQEDQAVPAKQQHQQIQQKREPQPAETPRVSPGEGVVDPPRKRKELDVDIDEAKLKEKRKRQRSQAPAETKRQAITDEELLEQELEIGVELEVAKEKGSPLHRRARTADVNQRERERSRERQDVVDRNRDVERRHDARERSFGVRDRERSLERRERSLDDRYRDRSLERRERSFEERSFERVRERNSVDERTRERAAARESGWDRSSDGRIRERSYGKMRPLEEVPEEGELPPEPALSPRADYNRRQTSYDYVRSYGNQLYDNRRRRDLRNPEPYRRELEAPWQRSAYQQGYHPRDLRRDRY